MAKPAELAHIWHTNRRLGRAPYYDPRNLNFVVADARRKFIDMLNEYAPPAVESLLDLAGAHEYDAGRCSYGEWARQFNLTSNGRIADWLLYPARLTVSTWQAIPGMRAPILLNFQPGELPIKLPNFAPADCRIKLPELGWNPYGPALSVPGAVEGETRADCRERIMRRIEAELDRIERAARRRGAQPCPAKRDSQHFEWCVRFQVNREPIRSMAASLEHERTIRAAIADVLGLIGLDKRRDLPGRPCKIR
jgi:hypothetical protein